MYLNSIQGLHLAIRQSEAFIEATTREFSPMNGNLLIDKCNVFCHFILQKNGWNLKDNKALEAVPLNKITLRDQIGKAKDLSIVKSILFELGVIYTDNYYNTHRVGDTSKPTTSKKYIITKEWIEKGVVRVGVLDQRTIKKLNNYKQKQFKQLTTQRIHQRILRSLAQLQFNQDEAFEKFSQLPSFTKDPLVRDPKQKMLTYVSAFETLSELNELDGEGYEPLLKHNAFYYDKAITNRVYHYHTNIPSIYRESLRHKDGTRLVELDLKNSQPTMLLFNFLGDTSEVPTYIEALKKEIEKKERNINRYISGYLIPTEENYIREIDKLFKAIVKNGTLYEAVAEHALSIGDIEYYELYKENRGAFKQQIIAYGLFNVMLPLEKIHKAERYLLEMFPLFMHWIRLEKLDKGYKYIPHLAQKKEASIFIDGIFGKVQEHSFGFAVPIHDSLLVKEHHEDYWRERLYNAFRETFPHLTLPNSLLETMIKTKAYNG